MKPDLLVIDIECTCGPGIVKDLQEIIEIGAVRVDPISFEIKGDFECLVCPRLTKITPFCESLTGINQEMVDNAVTFDVALASLGEWMGAPMIFCSWGEYDRAQFKEQAAREKVDLPPFAGFINLKKSFSIAERVRRLYGLERALDRKGMKFIGKPHGGLADARNTARLVPFCLGVGK